MFFVFQINIRFWGFDVEKCAGCECDALRVYQGSGSRARLLTGLCGYEMPDGIVVRTNHAILRFTSDHAVGGEGFGIEISETARSM